MSVWCTALGDGGGHRVDTCPVAPQTYEKWAFPDKIWGSPLDMLLVRTVTFEPQLTVEKLKVTHG